MATSASSHSQDEDDPETFFAEAMDHFKVDRLPQFASTIRKKLAEKSKQSHGSGLASLSADAVDCTVLSQYFYGSYNMLYPVEFTDGLRWLLKLPAIGYPGRFGKADGRALAAEALTMQMIKQKTTIPIPEVFAFDPSVENELGCAFILMEYVKGVRLGEFWFDKSQSQPEIEQRRLRVLDDIGAAVIQLNQFRFNEGGCIIFDDAGNPGVGPRRKAADSEEEDDQADKSGLGPYKSQTAYFHSLLDSRDPPSDKSGRGLHKMLRLFLDWIPCDDDMENGPFVLSHPDYDIQNIIVSPEGRLRAIIDWDGVEAEPGCLGNERYPGWLTRDWDPLMYGYEAPGDTHGEGSDSADVNPTTGIDGDAPHTDKDATATSSKDESAPMKENSPVELDRYRRHYRSTMGALVTKARILADQAVSAQEIESTVRLTRNSLMIDNLVSAASNQMCYHAIMLKIFEEISFATEEEHAAQPEVEYSTHADSDSGSDAVPPSSSDEKPVMGQQAVLDSPVYTQQQQQTGDIVSSPAATDDAENDEFVDAMLEDTGEFDWFNVALALADGELDETRMARLKAGFEMFCS